MSKEQMEWIEKSIKVIESGITNKVVSVDKIIQVYQCGAVIRIDIKK